MIQSMIEVGTGICKNIQKRGLTYRTLQV